MKKRNLFGFLRKREEPVKAPVYGIRASQYYDIVHDLEAELSAAASRQRASTTEPSGYMKGIMFAIKLIASYKPDIVGVEQ